MRRGDIIVASQRGDYTGKPRPYVVVQRGSTLGHSSSVTACPITSELLGPGKTRIALPAGVTTGLLVASEVEINRIATLRRERVSEVIGQVPSEQMRMIDKALKIWLDL